MNTSALTQFSRKSQRTLGDAYLKFQLCANAPAVISMRHAQEALTLSARQLTPMPNMPSCMLGLMNRRSRVLWVVDLAQLLGLSMLGGGIQQYNLIIVQVGSVPLGLAVQQVEGITWLEASSIQSPLRHVDPTVIPYLSGCVLQQQEIVLVLDATAVLNSPIFQSY
ncbi:MAG TPA: chemotaxis protein CheW [Crinalium sp.]|jgi:twitching motility protein PilI